MNILMLSKSGDGLGIAQKLVAEGHSVKVWIKEPGFKYAGLGLVERVSAWRPHAASSDLIFADMVGFGKLATSLDTFKAPNLGFNIIADTLELDRSKQMQVLKRFGIGTPETYEFDTPNAALDLLEDWGSAPGWVVKPSGNLDTGKTYVVHDKPTYRWVLEQYSGSQALIVQRFVKGIEVSTEGWFNGSEWLSPFNHTFEEKRLFPENLGPNTGCMGNVVVPIKNPQQNKLVKALRSLTPFLKLAEYRGPLDLNAIIDETGGINALELTTRMGYDAVEALHEIFSEPFGDFLLGVATGTQTSMKLNSNTFALATRLTIPPYPFGKADPDERGLPVLGLPDGLNHYYPTDIMKDRGQFKWSASDGVLLKVTSAGRTVKAAQNLIKQRVERVKVLGKTYRSDIGNRVDADMKKLQELGVSYG